MALHSNISSMATNLANSFVNSTNSSSDWECMKYHVRKFPTFNINFKFLSFKKTCKTT